MPSHRRREQLDSPALPKPRLRHPGSIGLGLFPFVLTSNICELDLSSNQGNTTNLVLIPSWSWLHITVQTTTYSPGSLGAATVNSWVPGLRRKSQSGTGFRSFARSSEKPCIEPSRFRFFAFLAVIRKLICSPVFTVMTGCFWSLIL